MTKMETSTMMIYGEILKTEGSIRRRRRGLKVPIFSVRTGWRKNMSIWALQSGL